jgi:flagellar protein FlbD
MIVLHRLGRNREPFHLNPDLIVTVEAVPDTHVVLSTGTKYVVCESPDEVAAEIRDWRAGILTDALRAANRTHA